MSQSSNSSMDNNISLGLSKTTADNKANSSKTQQGMKRVASVEFEYTSKRTAVDHGSCEKQVPSVDSKPLDQAKFISAAELVANVRTNVQLMLEISDEEFLKMALEFEKKHPQ